MLFDGFETRDIDIGGGITIHARTAGRGDPVLLLHGHPQTHAMWHLVAPELAKNYAVVVADLRGYGNSSKPPGAPPHETYSKRAMAADQVALMRALGHDCFAVCGHDRGGRVGHRMALDHPDRVKRLCVLDIVPTHKLFANTDKAFALGYYHWFFLAQPFDLPERMIGADPVYFLDQKLGHWSRSGATFDPRALAEYRRCFSDPATIHASCEDYRAAASIDLEHDAADLAVRLTCPTHVLWGQYGLMHKLFDVSAAWLEMCHSVTGRALPSGHFLAEEAPSETIAEIHAFLAADQESR
ncbi:MAG: alpha/beta hydrolase [Proteobacteria bacterium]|nr:alpha/beta hydrolase [Pseudomonadota bacterium]